MRRRRPRVPAGLLVKARGDYRRILGALYAQGYYGGAISIRVGGREADGLPPDTELPDPVAVEIVVDPGPAVHLRLDRDRQPCTADERCRRRRCSPSRSVGFAGGQVAQSTVVLAAEQLAVKAWEQQGYAKAAIASRDVVADHDTNTVDVTIVVDPGGVARVGDIGVSGTDEDEPGLRRPADRAAAGRASTIPTTSSSPRSASRASMCSAPCGSRRREALDPDGTLPMTVIVEELPLRRFGVGATYSTTDGLGLEGFHLWRNLFGQAERLRLDAKIAGIGYPDRQRRVRLCLRRHLHQARHLDAGHRSRRVRRSPSARCYDTYTETSAIGAGRAHALPLRHDDAQGRRVLRALALRRRFRHARLLARGPHRRVHLRQPRRGDQRDARLLRRCHRRAVLRVRLRQRGVPLDRRGAGPISASAPSGRFVLAGRAKIGGIWGADLMETPPDRLFFAGGGGSVRGYPFKGIGVPGPNNTLTGGRYLIEGSVEARVKVWRRHRARRLPRWRLRRGGQLPGPRPAAARRRRRPPLLHRLRTAAPRSRLPAQQGEAGRSRLRALRRHRTGILRRLLAAAAGRSRALRSRCR